jgi:hypothetical protein
MSTIKTKCIETPTHNESCPTYLYMLSCAPMQEHIYGIPRDIPKIAEHHHNSTYHFKPLSLMQPSTNPHT